MQLNHATKQFSLQSFKYILSEKLTLKLPFIKNSECHIPLFEMEMCLNQTQLIKILFKQFIGRSHTLRHFFFSCIAQITDFVQYFCTEKSSQ